MKPLISILVGSGVAVAALLLLLLLLPRVALEWTERRSPEVVFAAPVGERMVALSIDDGPSAATPEILRVLDDHGARATFFLIGEHVRARPELARRIAAAGHELGHHMLEDRPSRELPEDEFERRFDEVDRLLDEFGGSRLFRPASGWYDDRMVAAASRRGYRTVLGSVYPFDAAVPVPSLLAWYVLRSTVPGSVLILHDGPERGTRTADVLRTVLPELRRRGYRIVTISELLAGSEARASALTPLP